MRASRLVIIASWLALAPAASDDGWSPGPDAGTADQAVDRGAVRAPDLGLGEDVTAMDLGSGVRRPLRRVSDHLSLVGNAQADGAPALPAPRCQRHLDPGPGCWSAGNGGPLLLHRAATLGMSIAARA